MAFDVIAFTSNTLNVHMPLHIFIREYFTTFISGLFNHLLVPILYFQSLKTP